MYCVLLLFFQNRVSHDLLCHGFRGAYSCLSCLLVVLLCESANLHKAVFLADSPCLKTFSCCT